MVRCVRAAGLFHTLFDCILRQHFVAVCVRWVVGRAGGVCGWGVRRAAKAGEGVPLARPEFPRS